MKNVLIFLGSVLFLLGVSSCQNLTKNDSDSIVEEANQRLTGINDVWKNQLVDLSAVLENEELKQPAEGRYTIMAYYDADCSACISDLKKWKSTLIPYFQEIDPKIDFKFVLTTGDRKTLDFNLEQVGLPSDYVIIDEKHSFLKTYDFADEKAFNTFLINPAREVVFIGSPLISTNLRDFYASSITG